MLQPKILSNTNIFEFLNYMMFWQLYNLYAHTVLWIIEFLRSKGMGAT